MRKDKKPQVKSLSGVSEDAQGREAVLSVVAGQFLAFAFFASPQDIEDLRPEMIGYLSALFGVRDDSDKLFLEALTRFFNILKEHRGWDDPLVEALCAKAQPLVDMLFGNSDGARALQEWQNMDSWGRFASIVESEGEQEASFADLLIEALLPILAGKQLSDLIPLFLSWLNDSANDGRTLDGIDAKLNEMALRFSFGSALSSMATNDIKLSILLNLPPPFDNPDLAVKTGMAFKFLSDRYNIQEVLQ